MRKFGIKIGLALAIVLFVHAVCFAGTEGTLSGVITDQQGNPLASASVMVLGTGRGAFTDSNGYFTIAGVQAGTWDVKAQLMGHETVTIGDVNIIVDQRTTLTITLKVDPLEGYRLEGYAEPLIRHDETTTRRIITGDEISTQVIDEFREVMSRTAGIVTEGGTDTGTFYHVRGGRSNEIVYMIDGVSVVNPISGSIGMLINTNAIEQISILTGGWDAQYGEAQSAIINIITKEGSDKFEGGFSFTQDVYAARQEWDTQMLLESTGKPDPNAPEITWHTSTRQPRRTKATANFGGPLTSKMSYFVSGDWYRDWTKYPVKDPAIEWNISSKVTYRFSDRYKLTFSGNYSDLRQDLFSIQYQYIIGSGYLDQKRDALKIGTLWTHYVTDSTFYSINFGYFKRHALTHVPGVPDGREEAGDAYKHDSKQPPGEQIYLNRQMMDPTGWFYTKGAMRWYGDERQYNWSVKGDVTSELSNSNQLKVGGVFKYYDVDYFEFQPLPTNTYVDVWKVKPYTIAAYVQDKLEYSSLVLNIGVRLDLLNPKGTYVEDPHDYADYQGHYDNYEDIPRVAPTVKYQISPRVGVSYPITERDKFHFSYGHFFQSPPFQYLFMSSQNPPMGAYPLLGWPDLEPEKTVQYEFGVEHIFTEDMVGDATVFFKDMRDLLDTERITTPNGTYTRVCNADFGNSRGFEITLDKRLSNMFAAKVAYTFSVSKGLASSFRQGYDYAYYGWVMPRRENLLDWDQTHSLDLTFDIRDVDKWGINVTMVYGSGMPYSTSPEAGQPAINDKRLPWTLNLDLKANYDIHLMGMKYSFYVEARNLINRLNVQNLGADEGRGTGSDWSNWLFYYNDPDGPFDDYETYGDPLIVRAGVSVQF